MAVITIDESQLNKIVREKLIDILKNNEDILEIMEDIFFGKMMEKSKTGEYVSKESVFEILDSVK